MITLRLFDAKPDLYSDALCAQPFVSLPRHFWIGILHAEVEFVARQRSSTGTATRLHERSRFVREGERWYYLEGDLQHPVA